MDLFISDERSQEGGFRANETVPQIYEREAKSLGVSGMPIGKTVSFLTGKMRKEACRAHVNLLAKVWCAVDPHL